MTLVLEPILAKKAAVPKPVEKTEKTAAVSVIGKELADPGKIPWNNFFASIFQGKKIILQQKIRSQIEEYNKTENQDEKNTLKMKLITELNNLFLDVLPDVTSDNAHICARLLVRNCIVTEAWMSDAHRELFSKIPVGYVEPVDMDFPVFYQDEWMSGVESGAVRSSKIEDARSANQKKSPDARLNQLYSSIETERQNLEKNLENREQVLDEIQEMIDEIMLSRVSTAILDENPPYNVKINNNSGFEKLRQAMSKMQAVERYLSGTFLKVDKLSEETRVLEQKLGCEAKPENTENDALKDEFEALRQMQKLCVGPRGNDFPYFYSGFAGQEFISRELLVSRMKHFLYLDSGLFYWKFQGLESNSCPYTVLLPCYGESGCCWEPIDYKNKASGRGKLGIPMYPANNPPDRVILSALAQYRWLKEKELMGTYWMNEGITGNYYMYHENLKKLKRKGTCEIKFDMDLKRNFINDYILWMMFESQGMQKLSKDARQLFYNHMPFPDDLKDSLKDRGYHYKVLWENDQRKKGAKGY